MVAAFPEVLWCNIECDKKIIFILFLLKLDRRVAYGFALVPKSVTLMMMMIDDSRFVKRITQDASTLNGLEQRNGRYLALFYRFCGPITSLGLRKRQKSIPRRTIRPKIDPLAYVRPTQKA